MNVEWTFTFRVEIDNYLVLSGEYLDISVREDDAEKASEIAHAEAVEKAVELFEVDASEIKVEEVFDY
jgi:hypothetical protein